MPVNECIPFFEPASRPTGRASATVRGKRFVVASGSPVGGMAGTENVPVAEAGTAGVQALAVSCYDAASGEAVPLIRNGAIVPMTSGAAVTANDPIKTDAQGRAISQGGTGIILGIALETVGAADTDVAVALLI